MSAETEYAEGYAAFLAGVSLAANPYPDKLSEGMNWADGWIDAETEAGQS